MCGALAVAQRCSIRAAAVPPSVPTSVADLEARGVLRPYLHPRVRLSGEVGSGYKSGANELHIEPEEIFLLGTSQCGPGLDPWASASALSSAMPSTFCPLPAHPEVVRSSLSSAA